jgi:hypothetical protein
MKYISLGFVLVVIMYSAAANAACDPVAFVQVACGTNATCFDQQGPTAAVNAAAQAAETKVDACAGANLYVVASRRNSSGSTTTFTWNYTVNAAGGVVFSNLEIDHEQVWHNPCPPCQLFDIVADNVTFTVGWPPVNP